MVLSKGGDMDTLIKLHSLDSVRLGWKLGAVSPQLAPRALCARSVLLPVYFVISARPAAPFEACR